MFKKFCYPDPIAGTGAGQDWIGSTTLGTVFHHQMDIQLITGMQLRLNKPGLENTTGKDIPVPMQLFILENKK